MEYVNKEISLEKGWGAAPGRGVREGLAHTGPDDPQAEAPQPPGPCAASASSPDFSLGFPDH